VRWPENSPQKVYLKDEWWIKCLKIAISKTTNWEHKILSGWMQTAGSYAIKQQIISCLDGLTEDCHAPAKFGHTCLHAVLCTPVCFILRSGKKEVKLKNQFLISKPELISYMSR